MYSEAYDTSDSNGENVALWRINFTFIFLRQGLLSEITGNNRIPLCV